MNKKNETNSISFLAKEIIQRNIAEGFPDESKSVGEFLMWVVSELGKALEADRNRNYSSVSTYNRRINYELEDLEDLDFIKDFDSRIKDSFEDEIADAIIRLLGMSVILGIDIEWHVLQKMKYIELSSKLSNGKE